MRAMACGVVLAAVLAGCEGPDEVICELTVGGVDVCVDLNSKKYCEKEWGGTATDAEIEPGGPYAYCADVYEVACAGSLHEEGENFSAEHSYYAASEEDCAAAEGGTIGG